MTLTLKELLAQVPGSQRHTVEAMVGRGEFKPLPELDASLRRRYLPAHVDQLRARVERIAAKRARRAGAASRGR